MYRDKVSKLNTEKARILDISHEIIEKTTNRPKFKQKLKVGRPPKIKTNNNTNNKNIEEYFIKQN